MRYASGAARGATPVDGHRGRGGFYASDGSVSASGSSAADAGKPAARRRPVAGIRVIGRA